jgi:23S rRNA (cytidine1920-2'-O)/16S rRNA (cytidine1409-2'-O)-methyltransferase
VSRRRLDAELVRRGLAPSRAEAARLVAAGRVLVRGAVADKVARQVDAAEPVVVQGPPPRFVGRGGAKLRAGLDRFGIDPAGARCLDAGASTGGFTDCLLQAGAGHVLAIDVGHGQMHERLRGDPRVTVRERTNLRHVDPSAFVDEGLLPVELVVADLSFISLTMVLEVLVSCASPSASLVVLVKPQFEVGREEASRGRGVVTDPSLWSASLGRVTGAAAAAGATIMDAMESPLRGADGNVEFLLHLATPPLPPRVALSARACADVDDLLAATVRGVGGPDGSAERGADR